MRRTKLGLCTVGTWYPCFSNRPTAPADKRRLFVTIVVPYSDSLRSIVGATEVAVMLLFRPHKRYSKNNDCLYLLPGRVGEGGLKQNYPLHILSSPRIHTRCRTRERRAWETGWLPFLTQAIMTMPTPSFPMGSSSSPVPHCPVCTSRIMLSQWSPRHRSRICNHYSNYIPRQGIFDSTPPLWKSRWQRSNGSRGLRHKC